MQQAGLPHAAPPPAWSGQPGWGARSAPKSTVTKVIIGVVVLMLFIRVVLPILGFLVLPFLIGTGR
jgi:hypothetical protein